MMKVWLLVLSLLPFVSATFAETENDAAGTESQRKAILETRQQLRAAERELRDASRQVERLRLQQALAGRARTQQTQVNPEELSQVREALTEARRQLKVVTEQLGDVKRAQPLLRRQSGQRILELRRDPRPMVGIIMEPMRGNQGVKLRAVTPGGPAADAGLRGGDELLAIDGEPVNVEDGVELAYDLLDGMVAGDVFNFSYQRSDREQDTIVEAREMKPEIDLDLSFSSPTIWMDGQTLDGFQTFRFPDSEDLQEALKRFELRSDHSSPDAGQHAWPFALGWNGLQLAKLNPDLGAYFGATRGALVVSTDGRIDSDLRAGDVILEIDGKRVNEPRQAMRLLGKLANDDAAEVTLLREGSEQSIELSPPEGRSGLRYRWFSKEQEG